MANSQIQPPEPFNFKNNEDWPKWIRRFERYRIVTGLDEKEGSLQVNTLLYTMGDEADDILKSFTFNKGEDSKYDVVKAKFDKHFIAKRNVIFERAKFNMRKQEQHETLDNFITSLYGLAEHCNFGILKNELIRDRIVVGIIDQKLSEKMQLDPSLTLEKACDIARQSESVKKQQGILRSASVDVVTHRKHPKKITRDARESKQQHDFSEKCMRCGKANHNRNKCPAREATCHKCKKKGHFANVCKSGKVNEVEVQDSDEEYFFGEYETKRIMIMLGSQRSR